MKIDSWLMAYRIRAGWTQTELAQRVGVNRHTLICAEKGRAVTPETAKKLAKVFGITYQAMMNPRGLEIPQITTKIKRQRTFRMDHLIQLHGGLTAKRIREIAKKSGLSWNTIYRALRGKGLFNNYALRLAEAMGIPKSEVGCEPVLGADTVRAAEALVRIRREALIFQRIVERSPHQDRHTMHLSMGDVIRMAGRCQRLLTTVPTPIKPSSKQG